MAAPEQVSIAEVKRRMSSILDSVAKGNRYLLVRSGKPVAMLGPVPQDQPPPAAAGVGARPPMPRLDPQKTQALLNKINTRSKPKGG